MIGAVPPIDPEIEQDDIEDESNPTRKPDGPQADRLASGPSGDGNNDQRSARHIDEPEATIPKKPCGIAEKPAQSRRRTAPLQPIVLCCRPNPLQDEECDQPARDDEAFQCDQCFGQRGHMGAAVRFDLPRHGCVGSLLCRHAVRL